MPTEREEAGRCRQRPGPASDTQTPILTHLFGGGPGGGDREFVVERFRSTYRRGDQARRRREGGGRTRPVATDRVAPHRAHSPPGPRRDHHRHQREPGRGHPALRRHRRRLHPARPLALSAGEGGGAPRGVPAGPSDRPASIVPGEEIDRALSQSRRRAQLEAPALSATARRADRGRLLLEVRTPACRAPKAPVCRLRRQAPRGRPRTLREGEGRGAAVRPEGGTPPARRARRGQAPVRGAASGGGVHQVRPAPAGGGTQQVRALPRPAKRR